MLLKMAEQRFIITKTQNSVKDPVAQPYNNRYSVYRTVSMKTSWCHLFSFSLLLNKQFFCLFPFGADLLFRKTVFPWERRNLGESACEAGVYENGGDRMLMRGPGALPPPTVPWSAPLCQPVMNLLGCAQLACHPVSSSFFTHHIHTLREKEREGRKQAKTHDLFNVNRRMSCLFSRDKQQHISGFLPESV